MVTSDCNEINKLNAEINDLRSASLFILDAQMSLLSLSMSVILDEKKDTVKLLREIQDAQREAFRCLKGEG